MRILQKAWRGEYGLAFAFWILGCLGPLPIVFAKVALRDAGIFDSDDTGVWLAGQAFLWFEWAYFAFITVALWNASVRHLKLAREGSGQREVWGQIGRVLAVASALLALGSLANLTGLTTLIIGRPLFLAG